MFNVAAFTGGVTVPSARFRVRQYVPHLARLHVNLHEFQHKTEAYPPVTKWHRPIWAAQRLAEVGLSAAKSKSYDVSLLQREFISSYFTFEGFSKSPRILDVDDSIHLLRGGRAAHKLAQACDRVIAGNSYLADIYSAWNKDIVILPTAVDSDKYHPSVANDAKDARTITIGWIGTAANFPYLDAIEPALRIILEKHPDVQLKIVSNRSPTFASLPKDQWAFSQWSEKAEVADIQSMTIGIMPLEDGEWARGKCSFKMLQYMACGIPVVVSPVGMNAQVLAQGEVGYGASTIDDWVSAIETLIEAESLRTRLGRNGRDLLESHYSLNRLAPVFAGYLKTGSIR